MGEHRFPDYLIKAFNKDTRASGEVGAVWVKDDGSLYIKFNPYVTVPVGDTFVLTAFANDGSRSDEKRDDGPRQANFRIVEIPGSLNNRRAKRQPARGSSRKR